MRAPPAVELSLDQTNAWRLVQAVLVGLAAASLTHWWAARLSWPQGVATLAVLSAGVASLGAAATSLTRWQRQPVSLRWTGQIWQCLGPGGATLDTEAPDVMFDLGAWMLLRVRAAPQGPTLWLATRAPRDRLLWAAFRAAVYSPASRPPGSSPTDLPRS